MTYRVDMTRRCLGMVLVAGCTTSGSSSPIEYRRLDLPGFTLDAPTDMVLPPDLEYRAGEIQHRRPTGRIEISWQVGPIFTVEDMPPSIRVVAEEFARGLTVDLGPASLLTVGGQKAIRMDGSMGGAEITFVDITCGGRSVLITLAGARAVEESRTRILDSFRCRPVVAEEQLLSLPPIGADDPAILRGWRYTDDDRSILSITNGEEFAVFVEVPKPESDDPEKVRKLLPKLFGAAGATFRPTASGGRETRKVAAGETRSFDRGHMTVGEETVPVVLSYWECSGSSRGIAALLVTAEESGLVGAIDLLSRIRCSRPGDPALDIGPPRP